MGKLRNVVHFLLFNSKILLIRLVSHLQFMKAAAWGRGVEAHVNVYVNSEQPKKTLRLE